MNKHSPFINPQCACAARVMVVVISVCLCVCSLSHISPLALLFVVKTLPRTKHATKVKKLLARNLGSTYFH